VARAGAVTCLASSPWLDGCAWGACSWTGPLAPRAQSPHPLGFLIIVLPGKWALGSLWIGQLSAPMEKQIPCPTPRSCPPSLLTPARRLLLLSCLESCAFSRRGTSFGFIQKARSFWCVKTASSGPRRQQPVAAGCAPGGCIREGSHPCSQARAARAEGWAGPFTPHAQRDARPRAQPPSVGAEDLAFLARAGAAAEGERRDSNLCSMFGGDPDTGGGFLSEPRHGMAHTGVCGLGRTVPPRPLRLPSAPAASKLERTSASGGSPSRVADVCEEWNPQSVRIAAWGSSSRQQLSPRDCGPSVTGLDEGREVRKGPGAGWLPSATPRPHDVDDKDSLQMLGPCQARCGASDPR